MRTPIDPRTYLNGLERLRDNVQTRKTMYARHSGTKCNHCPGMRVLNAEIRKVRDYLTLSRLFHDIGYNGQRPGAFMMVPQGYTQVYHPCRQLPAHEVVMVECRSCGRKWPDGQGIDGNGCESPGCMY